MIKSELLSDKITKNIVSYPKGAEPDFVLPTEYLPYRYALGKRGKNPLVVVCMNPSAASEEKSDRTINRIIAVSHQLYYDGWIVFNTYPERATNAANLGNYDSKLAMENLKVIKDFLIENRIVEVWGAWGNLHHESLQKGVAAILELFNNINVKVFYFGTLTSGQGNPRHPLQRQEKWTICTDSKFIYKV